MIVRPKEVLEGGLKASVLETCIGEFLIGAEKRRTLRAYYDGTHEIENRRRASGMPNNRLSHGFPRYICTVAAGYLAGNPVVYQTDERNSAALEAVINCYERCAVDSVDAELARAASICGKGVELLYADERARPCAACLDARSAFVIYDDSVENRPLLGMSYMPVRLPDGQLAGYRVQVYTDSSVLTYRETSLAEARFETPVRVEPHYFGCVPLIEYWNDEAEHGDFEDVIGLIDAYDLLQSDRMNDKQQFVDALLVLYGCTLETDERGRTPGQQLREDKALSLPDSDARAEWLCKQLNEADAEILRTAICSDIHKMSLVPDLTDAQFAGNSSGVAMRYKLLGLEQLTKIKERWFREGLRARLKGFAHFLACRGEKPLNADGVQMIFSRALPVNELECAQTLSELKDILPQAELARRAMSMAGRR